MERKTSGINNTTDSVVDRINDLPDSILSHILSFLPTKEAVATSILSKRWKFAWLSVHNLDFYYNDDDPNVAGDEAENMNFVRFVDRILLLIDVGPLNKFSLVWDAWPISSQVISWINTAITRNVRELYLSLGECETFDIPISGFNCDSLQSLELNVNDLTFLYDATVVCLPRLESLTLHGVHFTSREACEELISGCPMLHDLSLSIRFRYPGDDDFTCIISSASLRCLDIYFGDRSRLKLKASSLEYLCLRGRISGIFVEKKSKLSRSS